MAGRRLALSDLVLVMRKNVVDRAGVDVELLSEVLHRHRRALDMPAGPSAPPRRVPRRFSRLGALPESEVLDVLFLVFIIGDAVSLPCLRKIDAREPPVGGEARNLVPDAPIALIRVAARLETSDERDHLGDVIGGPGIVLRRLDAERLQVFEEGLGVAFREVAQRLPGGKRATDRLVVHVGQIHHLLDPPAQKSKTSPKQVFPDKRSQIADVNAVVDRGPARIEPRLAGNPGFELLKRPSERVN